MVNPQEQFNQALQLHQEGRIAEAIDLYGKALPSMEDNPQLLFLLGTALLQAGNHEDCIDLMQRALRLEPQNVFAHINQGNALQALGRREEAVAAFDRALALNADLPEVHNNRGAALLDLGRMDEALASCRRALALHADYAEAHNNCGYALKGLGHEDQALAAFDRALALRPDYAEAHNNRGATLLALDLAREALAAFEQALALRPDDAKGHANRGKALLDLARSREALAAFERALALHPGDAAAHVGRGDALQRLRRLDAALSAYDAALAIDPDDATAHNNRGAALLVLGRTEAALAAYDAALALRPDDADVRMNKAMLLLLIGRYLEGWELFEWRLKQEEEHYYRFPQPAWRGAEDIRGRRILVHGEQGFGDVIQFCRYLPQLSAMGAELIFEAPRPLVSLVSTLDAPMRVVARGEPLPDFDAYCPLISLPHAFKTTVETIPGETPYLYADEVRFQAWRQRLGESDRLRVGVVWSGSFSPKNPHRSMRLEQLLPLIGLPVEWHALQVEYREHDLVLLGQHPEIHQHQHDLHDFADTAALIACMDLVISIDTGVAHLAGAMGKPVWIMLSSAADYRWLLDRTDSPWYPTARLFRQPALDDWTHVVMEVGTALQGLADPA